ncbi:hypothetical protein DU002_16820 [Corallincola holothuriorum]|uniref:DUF7661 domain-containing protein n=1 Tax=Corallincola holothuriorum TaxID=2282215 RepID=A0A368N3I5_9GAMM|nr:hypothetical protein [Corallincola holothuriorum]RCU45092.1 hypothetical protein DU002_16820 [Corallincola holothuriorum]
MKLKFDVFGKSMSVQRSKGEWLLFTAPDCGIAVRVYDVVIPAELTAEEICLYLDDIYHEYASERHPEVKQL